ncbi:hypothetical protein LIER_28391 [Lithospermum erythrorhizon]|uniref:Uncharacterized protein n=1 Tax=Lithospermum erythrorhizon TaxID=34254 RepID=A0AAV3RIG4_LITER
MLGTALVSWKSKKQPTVVRSSSKAEYRSAAAATCELKWISFVLKDMKQSPELPIRLHYLLTKALPAPVVWPLLSKMSFQAGPS